MYCLPAGSRCPPAGRGTPNPPTTARPPPPNLPQGTVLIRSAEELEGYSRGEEDRIEEVIKGIAGGGACLWLGGVADVCVCVVVGVWVGRGAG